MFCSVTWTSYFLFIGIMLVVYTLILAFLYYRREMNKLFFSRREAMQEMIEKPVTTAPQQLHMVHELVSELGGVIRAASENNTVIPELMVAIKNKIKDFPWLQNSEYIAKVNLYIARELEIYGYHEVNQEAIEQLWK